MLIQDNMHLSASEKVTLRYIAEGVLHPPELDGVALQHLKGKPACSNSALTALR